MASKELTPADRARWLAGMPKGATLSPNAREIPYTAHGAVTAIQAGDVFELVTPDPNELLVAVDAAADQAAAVLVRVLVSTADISEPRAKLLADAALGLDSWRRAAREIAIAEKPLSVELEEALDAARAEAERLAQRVAEAIRQRGAAGRASVALAALRGE